VAVVQTTGDGGGVATMRSTAPMVRYGVPGDVTVVMAITGT
jgi:hypothetical protein